MTDTSTRYLRPQALAERWDIAPKTLAKWRTEGTGPAFTKIGGAVRYPLSAIEAHEAAALVQRAAA